MSFTLLIGFCVTLYYSRRNWRGSIRPDHMINFDLINNYGEEPVASNDNLTAVLRAQLDDITNITQVKMSFLPHDIQQRRSEKILKVCKDEAQSQEFARDTLVSRKHKFLYCPVEKTASTFWRRFIFQLERTNPVRSPFDVTIQRALASMGPFKFNLQQKATRQNVLDNYTKLLFVRDPYSRLFSAFVDKLMAPNPVFWKMWGKPAIQENRHNLGTDTCGNDVTFSEFVGYALSSLRKTDHHVKPIFELCTPCSFNYTVIGKMETFTNDTEHLLSLLNLKGSLIGLEKMGDDVVKDAIEDSVHDSLSPGWLRTTLKCVSKEDITRRIWRKLQIRGFISWRIKYDKYAVKMNARDFTKVLMKAQKASTNSTDLKFQKKQAFFEAFSTLSAKHFSNIATLFRQDFKLFDYESNKKHLMQVLQKGVPMTGALDWTKDWVLS